MNPLEPVGGLDGWRTFAQTGFPPTPSPAPEDEASSAAAADAHGDVHGHDWQHAWIDLGGEG